MVIFGGKEEKIPMVLSIISGVINRSSEREGSLMVVLVFASK